MNPNGAALTRGLTLADPSKNCPGSAVLARRETERRKLSCRLMSLHQTSRNLGLLESREAERIRRLEIQLVQSQGADDANNMSNDVRLLSCL